MVQPFEYFVIFANMRTGSNFLEENINDYAGLTCWGEVFNPHFIGHAGKDSLLGIDMAMREADPFGLLDRLRGATEGLAGFRFFPGHDPRVMDEALRNPRCAKVILTRNPIESYVSHKIAAETGQWRLGDMKNAKRARVSFDKAEFEAMLSELQAFQLHLLNALQISGQTAFYLGYDDLQDVSVLNGLARFLGCDQPKERTNTRTKVQNPQALRDKVENYDEMVAALAGVDHFNLSRTPNFEPRRGPNVPRYIAAEGAPLLYMPIKGTPEDAVAGWLDGLGVGGLRRDFTQKTLRQWKRQRSGHRSFTMVAHPVARLHRAFCQNILPTDGSGYPDIRARLKDHYGLPLPTDPGQDYGPDAHRRAFIAFADWVRGNLAGQTSVRVDASWASQAELVMGFSQLGAPDVILRADDLAAGLSWLAMQVGTQSATLPEVTPDAPHPLAAIYDETVEAAVKAAYQKDYMMFGFGPYAA